MLKKTLALTPLFFFLLTGCTPKSRFAMGTLPPIEAPTVSERAVAKSVTGKIESDAGVELSNSGADYERTRKIVDKLVLAAGSTTFTYPIRVVRGSEEVNAAAVNGSAIIVYEDFLQKVTDDEELAAILGHEVGHIIAKHHADDTSTARKSNLDIASSLLGATITIGAAIAGADVGTASDLGDVASGATSIIGAGGYVLAYERFQEYEADELGMTLMAKAGYNPEKAISFWAHSDEVFGASSGGFFSTHPGGSDRQENLQKNLPVAYSLYQEQKEKLPSNTKLAILELDPNIPETIKNPRKQKSAVPVKMDEKALIEKVTSIYRELKLPEDSIQQTIGNFQESIASYPPKKRIQFWNQVLVATERMQDRQ